MMRILALTQWLLMPNLASRSSTEKEIFLYMSHHERNITFITSNQDLAGLSDSIGFYPMTMWTD